MYTTWKDKPTIINKIPNNEKTMILFIDESGEANKKNFPKSLSV